MKRNFIGVPIQGNGNRLLLSVANISEADYLCGNVQNKQNGRCYGDVFNQMYILILAVSKTTINISTNINFEQIMVDFSINCLCKVFHQANFEFDFKEIGIDFEQVF